MKNLTTTLGVIGAIVIVVSAISCKKCNDSPTINSFVFGELSPPAEGVVDNSAGTITVQVPSSTDLTSLVPTITLSSACLSVSPPTGVAQDFSNTVAYEVKNEAGEPVLFCFFLSSAQDPVGIPGRTGKEWFTLRSGLWD